MKKNRNFLAAVIGLILILSSQSADAQKKWSFELKPGVSFPTKDLHDAKLKTGFGFEGVLAYRFMPHLAAYAGWSWNKFNADKSFAGNDTDFEETGYSFGLQFVHPFPNSSISFLLNAGGTYNHIETENSEGNIINDTGHGPGWQAGAGVSIPLGNRWNLAPEARYRSLSRDLKIGNVKIPADLNYVSAGLGVSYSF